MATEDPRITEIASAKESLVRMQEFDVNKLPRERDLGTSLNFADVKQPAQVLVDFYKQFPLEGLDWLNTAAAQELRKQADADFHKFDEILKFDPGSQSTPSVHRDALVQKIRDAYDPAFSRLHQYISYATGRVTDFTRLGHDARALIQSVRDETSKLERQIEKRAEEAEQVLSRIREVAAEQGVSQQAIYFKTEAASHENSARNWLVCTIVVTGLLCALAIASAFLHKWPWLSPVNTHETIQLSVSKVLVLAVVGSFVILSARNYMAHKHNAVVNKHRQNALVTYSAIVEAAGDEANRDIVLAKAAECIFSDQPSGFSKADMSDQGPASLVSIGPGGIRPTISGGG